MGGDGWPHGRSMKERGRKFPPTHFLPSAGACQQLGSKKEEEKKRGFFSTWGPQHVAATRFFPPFPFLTVTHYRSFHSTPFFFFLHLFLRMILLPISSSSSSSSPRPSPSYPILLLPSFPILPRLTTLLLFLFSPVALLLLPPTPPLFPSLALSLPLPPFFSKP